MQFSVVGFRIDRWTDFAELSKKRVCSDRSECNFLKRKSQGQLGGEGGVVERKENKLQESREMVRTVGKVEAVMGWDGMGCRTLGWLGWAGCERWAGRQVGSGQVSRVSVRLFGVGFDT